MAGDGSLIFFHGPQSRSGGALALLEELGAPFELRVVNLRARQNREPGYLAVNPMGKVPAILHGDVLVTEHVAIFIYLADLFAERRLAPGLADPLRGPYLRWLVYYAACFEPALVDRAMKREPAPASTSPYGDYDTMLGTLLTQLRQGPWLLGDRFTAADILWGTALGWTTKFQLVPETPEVMSYIGRVEARPSVQRARAWDAELAAQLAPAD